jgi:hypothetical protein
MKTFALNRRKLRKRISTYYKEKIYVQNLFQKEVENQDVDGIVT